MADFDLLANPSFETGAGGMATGWSDFHTTASPASYSLTASGAVDGGSAQKISYAGQAGDSSALVELFQGPFLAAPGMLFTLRLWASGTYSGCQAQIGIAGSTAGTAYISETDTQFTGLSARPKLYSVSYTCPLTTATVACYFIANGIGPASAFSVALDAGAFFIPASIPLGVPHPGGGSGFDPLDSSADVGEPGHLGNVIGIPNGLA
jgi:hypothetical protein